MTMLTFILIMDNSNAAFLGMLSAAMHEMGHIIAILLKNGKIREVNFGLVNVDIINDETANFKLKSSDELFILFSGSVINFIFFFIFRIIYILSMVSVFKTFSNQNFFIGVINLLPINSLDGGKIFSIFFSRKFDLEILEKVLNVVSFIFLLPLVALGFLILIKSRYNFSLLILGCYLLSYILFNKSE